MAEAVERGDHLRPGGGQRLHAVPFSDDAVAGVAGLDDVGMAHAGPARFHAAMGVEERVLHALLDLETHNVECCHVGLPLSCWVQAC